MTSSLRLLGAMLVIALIFFAAIASSPNEKVLRDTYGGGGGPYIYADFTYNRTRGASPVTIQFTDASGSSDIITSWHWDFGNGETFDGQYPPPVVYTTGECLDTFTMTLTVSGPVGTDDGSQPIYVWTPLEAKFSYEVIAQNNFGQSTVQFTNESEGCPRSIGWSFGDGGYSENENPIHQYPAGCLGQYPVSLEIMNYPEPYPCCPDDYVIEWIDVNPRIGTGGLLLFQTYSTTTNPPYTTLKQYLIITRNPDEKIYISGSPDQLEPFVAYPDLHVNGSSIGGGPYTIINPSFPGGVPIETVVEPIPAQEITHHLFVGSKCAEFQLIDTQGGIYGSTFLYLVKEQIDPLQLEVPEDAVITANSTIPSYELTGFEITNSSTAPLAFEYNLTSSGILALVNNGNPNSLSGTTPVIEPGASYSPPPAALDIPEIREYTEQAVNYTITAVDFPDITQAGAMHITIEPPVDVLIQNFVASALDGAIEISWDIEADEEINGYQVFRRNGEESAEKILNGGSMVPPEQKRYIDTDIISGTTYYYTLCVVRDNGSEMRSQTIAVATKVQTLALEQNYPNPFNPSTKISFALPENNHVKLSIFNIEGRHITTLVDAFVSEGITTLEWDGTDHSGNQAASGVYFYRLQAGEKTLTKKMILLK